MNKTNQYSNDSNNKDQSLQKAKLIDKLDWATIDNMFVNDSEVEKELALIRQIATRDNNVWDTLAMIARSPARYEIEQPMTVESIVASYNSFVNPGEDSAKGIFVKTDEKLHNGNRRCAFVRKGDRTYDAILVYSTYEKGSIEDKIAILHIRDDHELGDAAMKGWIHEQTHETLNYEEKDYTGRYIGIALGTLFSLPTIAGVTGNVIAQGFTPANIGFGITGLAVLGTMGLIAYSTAKYESGRKNLINHNNAVALATLINDGKAYEGDNISELSSKMKNALNGINTK